jgi:glucokinase
MEKFYVGVDVGGTSIKMGMFSHTGELLEKWEIPTRVDEDEQTDRILPDIAASIEEKRAEKNGNIVGIGLGIPGPVTDDGTVLKCANIHWPVFNVKEKLFDLTGVANIRVGNDANVAALGEMWKGGGRGFDSIVMVTLGTGVGGGIIVDGKIVAGAHGAGGEVGHACVEPEEEAVCNCGNHGCLEQMTSATGIVRLAKKYLASHDTPSSLRERGESISAKAVFDALKEGDAAAEAIVQEFSEYLGRALAVFACVVDPEVIVVGGGVSKAGQILIDGVAKYYREAAFIACKDTPIVLASLGNDAGIYGAAKMLID